MKNIGLLFCLFFVSTTCFSQKTSDSTQNSKKGDFYFYWGWNWGWYTKSTIDFKGNDHDFTLQKVRAKDRQSKFKLDYFNPSTATIPQYNFRIGYYITDKFSLTLGTDHMKYVVQPYQMVKIDGQIFDTNRGFDGNYENEYIEILPEFLRFEHTDGLNYVNTELRYLNELMGSKRIKLSIVNGLGVGALFPKTNVTLWNSERYDEFHLSGFGINGMLGANVAFGQVFFFQTELKGGYFNMPDIRTTSSELDSAKQDFFFSQLNIVFGANLRSKKNK
ncbi:MAG: hypothetical protein ACPGVB_05915 [Chitinophagales bacterium]